MSDPTYEDGLEEGRRRTLESLKFAERIVAFSTDGFAASEDKTVLHAVIYADGFEKGHTQGYDEGWADGQAEMRAEQAEPDGVLIEDDRGVVDSDDASEGYDWGLSGREAPPLGGLSTTERIAWLTDFERGRRARTGAARHRGGA